MTFPWLPVVIVDIAGSITMLIISIYSALISWKWFSKKSGDIFRQYIFLLTVAIVFFAISRSFGHLVKQVLILNGFTETWKLIAPFSGAINSAIFIIIFAFSIYFHRFQKIHLEIEKYQNHLEELVNERTHELNESKAVLENVLSNSNPMCITSLDYEIVMANNAYYEIFAGADDHGAARKCYDSRPGSSCDTEECPVRQILAGNALVEEEVDKQTRDGGHQSFIITARPFINAEDELIGIIENFQDITQLKEYERDLSTEKERLATTLNSIGDGVISTSIDGRIVMLNRVAKSLTGWRQHEAFGRKLADVFTIFRAKTREPYLRLIDKVVETCSVVELSDDVILLNRNGVEFLLESSAAPIIDKQNAVVGVVIVFRDVTTEKSIEQELEKARKIESIGVLAGGIAHDFNNILTAIVGNISLAKVNLNPEDKISYRLQAAEKACRRATGLTQQLITFSKGGAPIKKTASIGELLHDSAGFILRGSNVKCEFFIQDDLCSCEIDDGQISQVINNMIINADQAMPAGGSITIRADNVSLAESDHLPLAAGQYVKIAIIDDGGGIAAEDLDKVFDPYFTTKEKGSGLGLASSYSIIKKHNGLITVKSTVGKGSEFSIYLPATSKSPRRTKEDRHS
ncbi:MAG: PAS domain-containing protein, partial [Desulfobulbales bacterium]|nr:PAS domain-containing protein [Desulfobulbales bacterium]